MTAAGEGREALAEVRAALLRDASIPGILAMQAERAPGKPALTVGEEELTYGQLIGRVATVAAWLGERGVERGDRVLIVGANSANLIVAALAAMWVGGVEVVANPALTGPELRHLLDDAEPAAVFGDRDQLAKIEDALGNLATACLEDAAGRPFSGGEGDGPAVGPCDLEPDELASLQYTSGTTGVPKGAELSHGSLVAYLRAVSDAWEWTADDVLVHSLPLSHGHGRNGVYTALLNGAGAVVLPRTDPSLIFATLRRTGATVFYAVPAIWDRLLSAPDFDPAAFAGLRFYTSGSAPLSPDVSDEVARLLGARPLERYGCTETGIVTTNPLHGPRHGGTVGLPVAGAEIRVASAAGDPLAPGEVGEVSVRGPSVFSGYWRRPEAADVFAAEGWFPTGDLGYFDADRDGHLVISGRSKELIITGGLNVYPREVELVAESLDGVRTAAVVGIPSRRWGEEIVLAVVPEGAPGAADGEALLAAMRAHLAPYKVPKQCKLVDEIPRNQTGKILRRELAGSWDRL